MPSAQKNSEHFRDLVEAIGKLNNPNELESFFLDLCTPAELTAMADRWRVAKLLNDELPYRKIYEQTGVSTATVTRVARTLSQGEGGYLIALSRCNASKTKEKS